MSTTRLVFAWTLAIGNGVACMLLIAAWMGLLDSLVEKMFK